MSDMEKVLQFCEAVGADPPLAQKYLLISENDLQAAISLYFDMGGADLPGDAVGPPASSAARTSISPSSVPAQPPTSVPAATSSSSTAYVLEDDDDDDDGGYVVPTDFAPVSSTSNGRNDDQDLAAILSQFQEPVSFGVGSAMTHAAFGGGSAAGRGSTASATTRGRGRGQGGAYVNPFAQRSGRGYVPLGGETPTASTSARTDSTELSERQSRLIDMYRPPTEIMYKGTFDSAKDFGRTEKKWLLVDVNDDTHFPCQVLNRDIWKNPAVVDVVKDSFVFVQIARHSAEGNQYVIYYPVNRYPCVSILDPRTGERVKELTKAQLESPAAVVEALYEFLDRFKLGGTMLRSDADVGAAPVSRPLTEDEQLQRALEASMQDTASTAKKSNVVVLDEDDDDMDGSDAGVPTYDEASDDDDIMMVDTSTAGAKGASTTPAARIAALSPMTEGEPAPGPTVTRIQIRFPDGQRLVRRFRLSDKVTELYRAVKQARPDTAGEAAHAFELVFVRQNLEEWLDKTIEEGALGNASVVMNYV